MTRVRVRVPATSANLGAGFDALGLALALYNELTASESDGTRVDIEGEGAASLARDPRNVVVRAVRTVYEAAGRRFPGVTLSCTNRIPLSRGLGSSAAAWVGGLVAANALLGGPFDRAALLTFAAQAEGHPDNVAAALHGGLTVACAGPDGVVALPLSVPRELRWVVLIPEVTSATTDARRVLPKTVPLGDAVFNVQRVALFVGALAAGRLEALGVAMEDRLHQPYRVELFPWMPKVADAAREAGALGCVLSGAGPCLLAAVTGETDHIADAMQRALGASGIGGVARTLDVDTEGAVAMAVS